MNRAKAAYDAASADGKDTPDFAVGLEGGLEKLRHPSQASAEEEKNTQNDPDELYCMAWMAIYGSNACIAADKNKTDKTATSWGYAKTGSFLLPPALCDLVLNQNTELGHADDKVFQRVNSKHGQGTVGKLTDGEIDRAEYYVHALKLALIPWIRPELYLQ